MKKGADRRMREILFRGKDIAGNWHYGDYEYFTDEFVKIVNHKEHEYGKKVEFETVGQYTGLKDKNGKKIFEGDIVECLLKYTGKVVTFTGEVKWSGYGHYLVTNEPHGMADRPLGTTAQKGEVIGNIHDNPELLKGERK